MTLADGYEPRFDRDYAYGRQAELAVDGLLNALARGDLRVQVKRKRVRDCVLYVETEQNAYNRGDWKASGIYTNDAEVYVYEVDDTGIEFVIPADRIRRALDLGLGDPKECGGSNPTRGRLLNLGLLISRRCDP